MFYQLLKYFLVRAGSGLFLFLTCGFFTLYFFQEIILSQALGNDHVLEGFLAIMFFTVGFFGYGYWGRYRYSKALEILSNTDLHEDDTAVKKYFEDLIYFSRSSFFLPQEGRHIRLEIIREYADYLHSIGKDDTAALRVYLQAFLQDPKDSRFRLPLLSILKQHPKLDSREIDLLLVMFKTGTVTDRQLATHLANIFMASDRFNRKTEPVFQAVVESGEENVSEVISFVLPHLLKKKRNDEYALNFYLNALNFEPKETGIIRPILAKSFIEGHWQAVDPNLHEKLGKVYRDLHSERKEFIKKTVKESRISEKWKRFRMFQSEEIQKLEKLKLEFGIVQGSWETLISGGIKLAGFIINALKKVVLITLDGLIFFSHQSLKFRLTSFFIMGMSLFFWIIFSVLKPIKPTVEKVEKPSISNKKSIQQFTGSEESLKIYTLQIAAMTSEKQAEIMMARLKRKKIANRYIVKTKRRTGGYWYKIRVGKFRKKQSAKVFAEQLVGDKIIRNYFIISFPSLNP